MRFSQVVSRFLVALCLCAAVPPAASAQIGALKRRAEEAKKKLEEEAAKKSAADSAARAKAAADSAKARAASTPASAAAPASGGAPAGGASAPAATPGKSDPKVWENYDFVPGDKVMFYTDFSEDRVGNFARGLKYRSGPLEVVERDGVKMLRSTGPSELLIPLGRTLPQRFTLEIDVIPPASGISDMVSFEGGPAMDRGEKSADVYWSPNGAWIQGSGFNAGNGAVRYPEGVPDQLIGHVTHLRVLMDSAYFKMYMNERRLYNIPELAFRRDSVIRIHIGGLETEGNAVFVTGIRVAESETDVLYDALAAKGRWATYGILFETGKAELKPESRAVLKEVAATLKQHPELKLLVEGHTDNVGTAASNLTLSDARAAAVKAALVAGFGVDEGRLTTKGFGDTKPASPNTTAAGRAQNRRVEFVKQ